MIPSASAYSAYFGGDIADGVGDDRAGVVVIAGVSEDPERVGLVGIVGVDAADRVVVDRAADGPGVVPFPPVFGAVYRYPERDRVISVLNQDIGDGVAEDAAGKVAVRPAHDPVSEGVLIGFVDRYVGDGVAVDVPEEGAVRPAVYTERLGVFVGILDPDVGNGVVEDGAAVVVVGPAVDPVGVALFDLVPVSPGPDVLDLVSDDVADHVAATGIGQDPVRLAFVVAVRGLDIEDVLS